MTSFQHPPRILFLYGSLYERSYSRLLAEEAARIISDLGAETKFFHPHRLPFREETAEAQTYDRELWDLCQWSEGQVWCSPDIHGNLTNILQDRMYWIPPGNGTVQLTKGKTLAIMHVSSGSQSIDTLNKMRVLGWWMQMFTVPSQLSLARANREFDRDGTMKYSIYREKIVNMMEELYKFTACLRNKVDCLSEFSDEENQERVEM